MEKNTISSGRHFLQILKVGRGLFHNIFIIYSSDMFYFGLFLVSKIKGLEL